MKMLKYVMIVWFNYLLTGSRATTAPQFIRPCKPIDSECILQSAKLALPYFADGVKELRIPPIEPIAIKDVFISRGDLKLDFKKVKIHQLSKCTISSISRDPVKFTANLVADCPLILKGDYTVGGRLYLLNIEGNGGFEISGGRIEMTVDLRLKDFIDKEGKKHYKVVGFDYKYDPTAKFDIKFENLFNGDSTRAKPIERLLSESWRQLIVDIGQPIMKDVIVRLVKVIDKFFRAVPTEDLEIA